MTRESRSDKFNIFKFWKEKSYELPHLARLARFILSCPASSAPSEPGGLTNQRNNATKYRCIFMH